MRMFPSTITRHMPGYWAMLLICAYIFPNYIANIAEAQSMSDDWGSLPGVGCENYATVAPPLDPTQVHRVGVGIGRWGGEHASK